MDAENTILISYDLWDLQEKGRTWQDLDKEVELLLAEDTVARVFIPQTMFDSCWVFYELRSAGWRNRYYNWIKENHGALSSFIRKPSQELIDKWIHGISSNDASLISPQIDINNIKWEGRITFKNCHFESTKK